MRRAVGLGFLWLVGCVAGVAQATPNQAWAEGPRREVKGLGKPAWRPMLAYDVELHVADTHPAQPPFEFPWEDTGRGYGYGPGFGHWDLVHEIIDVLPAAPAHAREELLNDVRLQLPSGFLPGLYWMRERGAKENAAKENPAIYDSAGEKFSLTQSHPPVWVVAADEYLEQTGNDKVFMAEMLRTARLQLGWFERERHAKPDGFLYLDIVNHKWESGVDEGVRFDEGNTAAEHPGSTACVDTTAQVYQEYVIAAKWARELGQDAAPLEARAAELRRFIQTRLWDAKSGFFYDSWVLDGSRGDSGKTPAVHSFEGMWPVVAGAATPEQARRVLSEWIMRPDRFFTPHPISTVARSDPKYEPRMWRGPVWNSMTWWAAEGALRYGYGQDAHRLMEAALDDTAKQFARTGVIWEFYDADGGDPEKLHRKPQTKRNMPFSDYLGHNPLLAMARLWQATASASR